MFPKRSQWPETAGAPVGQTLKRRKYRPEQVRSELPTEPWKKRHHAGEQDKLTLLWVKSHRLGKADTFVNESHRLVGGKKDATSNVPAKAGGSPSSFIIPTTLTLTTTENIAKQPQNRNIPKTIAFGILLLAWEIVIKLYLDLCSAGARLCAEGMRQHTLAR